MSEDFDFLFKIVLIGDVSVGKSCIVTRFKTGNVFTERHTNTIGVDFSMKNIRIGNKNIKIQLWDTAGHERFRSITSSYYRSAHGVLIVYDITKKNTFLSLQKWLTEIRSYTANNVICALIGNKCDLTEEREVTLDEAKQVCELVPEILFCLETSAKDNTNVENAFTRIAEELMNRQSCINDDHDSNNIKLGQSKSVSNGCNC
ncbi:hypothetical protein PVAND_001121 [Polypedilum vanderplanki]|uniref:Ras-related protein Rab-43 n=1 Tax=Polypedilum vanderplanki TaxID=319348 RepID=A0A9J6BLZ1_POLVA|nr:hypothetical protein PVAND_001121 [Polypedilum vanderplanki]